MSLPDFIEIDTSHIDDNGVLYIDGYTTDSEEGRVLGYFIKGEVYYTDSEYQFIPIVKETVDILKLEYNKTKVKDKDFPNGFISWIETSIEITEHLTLSLLNNDEFEFEHRGELYETVCEYTNEFEKLHTDTIWGEDLYFFEELDAFMDNKIKLLIQDKTN